MNRPSSRKLLSWLAVLAASVVLAGGSAMADAGTEELSFEGIWEGEIVYSPAAMEIEVLVELGKDPEGMLVGTTDIRTLHMKYHLLEGVETDGRKIAFHFLRDSERHGPDTRFQFTGELAEESRTIRGHFADGDKRHPFELRWIAEAGSPRNELQEQPLTVLSKDFRELREQFNRDAENVRLVLLLSPT